MIANYISNCTEIYQIPPINKILVSSENNTDSYTQFIIREVTDS